MADGAYRRKLDGMGRIMIPVKLREKVKMQIGKEYDFALREEEGRWYIMIDCGPTSDYDELLRLAKKYSKRVVD